MSYLARSFAPIRTSTRTFVSRPACIAPFHTSRARQALSESDTTGNHSADRESKIDHHKEDSVNKAKAGNRGEWKPELASNSEQITKHDNHDMSMEEMQKQGAEKAEEGKQPAGSSSSKP